MGKLNWRELDTKQKRTVLLSLAGVFILLIIGIAILTPKDDSSAPQKPEGETTEEITDCEKINEELSCKENEELLENEGKLQELLAPLPINEHLPYSTEDFSIVTIASGDSNSSTSGSSRLPNIYISLFGISVQDINGSPAMRAEAIDYVNEAWAYLNSLSQYGINIADYEVSVWVYDETVDDGVKMEL